MNPFCHAVRVISPRRAPRPLLTTVAVLALGGLALGGCAPSPTSPTPPSPAPTVDTAGETTAPVETPAPSETPTPTPTPVPVVDKAADTVVLFTITATMALSKGEADFIEVVRSPRTMTKAELDALHNGGCGDWPERIPNPKVQEVEFTSKLVSGTWPKDDEIFASAGSWLLYSGDWHGYQAACSTGIIPVPGKASALHLISGDDPDGGDGWATQDYGFGLVWDGAEPPDSGDPKVTACAIKVTPAAESASELVAHWSKAPQPDPDYACLFGEWT